jgi:hypothetical protein
MSRFLLGLLALAVLILIILVWTGFLSLEQTRQARLPSVDFNVQGGQMPAVAVDAKEVTIGTREAEVPQSVDVPVVNVQDGNGQR